MILAPRHESSKSIPTRKGWRYVYLLLILLFLTSSFIAVMVIRGTEETALPSGFKTENGTLVHRSGSKATQKAENKTVTGGINPISGFPARKTTRGIFSQSQSVRENSAGGSPMITITAYPTQLPEPISSRESISAEIIDKDTHLFDSVSADSRVTIPAFGNKPVVKTPYFTAGLYDAPEWMFNDLKDTRFMNYFGIEGAYHRRLFSISSGAGVSILQGKVENAIEYMDGVPKFDTANVTMRYTYLQIPVTFGYDIWQRGILKISVCLGTSVSVLLDKKQISDDNSLEENFVTESQRITPDEIGLNWQVTGGFNLSTELTKGIYFEISPMAKYYFQSFYEKSSSAKKPWSVGLRTALVFQL